MCSLSAWPKLFRRKTHIISSLLRAPIWNRLQQQNTLFFPRYVKGGGWGWLFLFVHFFFSFKKNKKRFCSYQKKQRKGKSWYLSHQEELVGYTEVPDNYILMLVPSLRTSFKWNRSPFFTAGCYGLLVTILLYAVLELGTRNKLKCFTLSVTEFMKNLCKSYHKAGKFFWRMLSLCLQSESKLGNKIILGLFSYR